MSSQALTKGERTAEYILQKVAPVFNRRGYIGTSMADITAATGLTKGAIYGNFENKEKLALAAFNYQFKWIVKQLNGCVMEHEQALDKLKSITNYYRNYYQHVVDYGGCPIMNISVDTNHQNAMLFERVKQVMGRMIEKIAKIIELGQEQGTIRQELDAPTYAELIFSQIEGSVFVAVMSKKPEVLSRMLDHVDQMIDRDMRT